MPKVSVVMPVYNGEEYLKEAIESILKQTLADFEFIIVEEFNNSPSSSRILNEYSNQDKRIIILHNEEKLGIAESLNKGLRAASGEYIARMDCDDVSGIDRFRVQTLFMDYYKDITICGIAPTVMNSPRWLVDYSSDPEIVKSDCLFFVPMKHPTIMLRTKDIVKYNLLYDSSLAGVEDYDLFVRASHKVKMTNIIEPELFYYRRFEGNASWINKERDDIIGRNILKNLYQKNFDIQLTENMLKGLAFLTDWTTSTDDNLHVLQEIEQLFNHMLDINYKIGTYKQYALEESMKHKWKKILINMKNAYGGKSNLPDKILDFYQNSTFLYQ